LKVLEFYYLNFQGIDLSFISRLRCLEQLAFKFCENLTYGHCEDLSKKKLCLKELEISFYANYRDRLAFGVEIEVLFNFLCSEALLKLTLNFITSKFVKAIKEYCPRIYFLHLQICSEEHLASIIPPICELSSLKFLNIEIYSDADANVLVKMLGDYLMFVECLILSFRIELLSFEYFTNNCKANLNKLGVFRVANNSYREYLRCVDDFQKVHNSLKVFGIGANNWIYEELEIICSLKNQGVNIVSIFQLYEMFGC